MGTRVKGGVALLGTFSKVSMFARALQHTSQATPRRIDRCLLFVIVNSARRAAACIAPQCGIKGASKIRCSPRELHVMVGVGRSRPMNLDAFLKTVRASKQFNYFYHFTDKKNLDSIRARGLLSASELRRLGLIKKVVTGGDAVRLATDIQKGNDQYVCLCFTKNHPMCFVASQRGVDPIEPTWLSINPDVIKLPDVMVTDAPSNQNGVVLQEPSQALDTMHLDAIYQWIDWSLNPDARGPRILAAK